MKQLLTTLALVLATIGIEAQTLNVQQGSVTYAFTAWEGSFMDSPVVREAYALNVPMQVAAGTVDGFSAFGVDARREQ